MLLNTVNHHIFGLIYLRFICIFSRWLLTKCDRDKN